MPWPEGYVPDASSVVSGALVLALFSSCLATEGATPPDMPGTVSPPPTDPKDWIIVTGVPFTDHGTQNYTARNQDVPSDLPWRVGQWWRYENRTQNLTSTWTVEGYLVNARGQRHFSVTWTTHDPFWHFIHNGTAEYEPTTLGQYAGLWNASFFEADPPAFGPLDNRSYSTTLRMHGYEFPLIVNTTLQPGIEVNVAAGRFRAIPVQHWLRDPESDPSEGTLEEVIWIPSVQNRAWFWQASPRGAGDARFELVAYGSWT